MSVHFLVSITMSHLHETRVINLSLQHQGNIFGSVEEASDLNVT